MSDEWDIFSIRSYKKIIEVYFRKSSKRGAMSRAAEYLNCQRSYLSRIIKTEMHLTPDQAFLLTKFWNLKSLESEYFITLVDLERAGNREYKEHLKFKLNEIIQRYNSLATRSARPQVLLVDEAQSQYFSSWHWTAIHFLTSIREFQTVAKLSKHLGLSPEIVIHFLEKLKSFGLVSQRGEAWEFKQGEFHLPAGSPYVSQNHQNWRIQAVLDSQLNPPESLHYTNIQTASREDIYQVKIMLLNFLEKCKKSLDPSKPEECVVLNCDLFVV